RADQACHNDRFSGIANAAAPEPPHRARSYPQPYLPAERRQVLRSIAAQAFSRILFSTSDNVPGTRAPAARTGPVPPNSLQTAQTSTASFFERMLTRTF